MKKTLKSRFNKAELAKAKKKIGAELKMAKRKLTEGEKKVKAYVNKHPARAAAMAAAVGVAVGAIIGRVLKRRK